MDRTHNKNTVYNEMFEYVDKATPGDIINEYIEQKGLSLGQFVDLTDIGPAETRKIIENKLVIGADIALKLTRAFPDTEPEFWLELGLAYEWNLLFQKKEAQHE